MDEAGLIERFRKGDRRAFDALVALHLDPVVGLARRMLRDAHEADDVAQDVFVAAYGMLGTWKPEAQLFTWLYRVTLNQCSRRLRERARAPRRSVDEAQAAPAVSPGCAELPAALIEALDALSEKQRDVFLGCHEQGLTLDEVAARLRISPGTARSHLHRALVALRERLRSAHLL